MERVGEVAAAEASLSQPSSAFLAAALPAVPALLLGFIFLEGRELVRTWPSRARKQGLRMMIQGLVRDGWDRLSSLD